MNKTKINQLTQRLPKGLVLLTTWLRSEGYPYELQQRYRDSGWLKSIGTGALIRTGDDVTLEGAIAALQTQAKDSIHIGGRTALQQLGVSHYLQINSNKVTLFANSRYLLPAWFKSYKWDSEVDLVCTTLFSKDEVGLVEQNQAGLQIKISGAARAIMECLYLCPEKFSLTEAFEIMEGLTSIRPTVAQEVLENCNSIKVKRLFLFLAEKAGHSWFKYINQSKIDLGTGKRSIVTNGAYISKYQIVVPKELA